MLYLRRRQNHSLVPQPRPGPQRDCRCIPGTGYAGVSSHRGHRWHTSWHRSSGRVSDSDTGSGAQGLGHQLNLNCREKQAELQSCSFRQAKRCCLSRPPQCLTLRLFWQFEPHPSQAPTSMQHQLSVPSTSFSPPASLLHGPCGT